MIRQQCSNCGKWNEYKEGEYQGRENTRCLNCGGILTVTGDFIWDMMTNEERKSFNNICMQGCN